jgi:hypothetical protein
MDTVQIQLDTQVFAYRLRIRTNRKTGVIIEKAAEKRKKHHDFLLS